MMSAPSAAARRTSCSALSTLAAGSRPQANCVAATVTSRPPVIPSPPLRQRFFRQLHAGPALGAESLERVEANLVDHLAAGCDPVAEIDIGQGAAARLLDQTHHDGAGETVGRVVWIEEAVNGR